MSKKQENSRLPDSANQAVDKVLVFLCRCFSSSVPYLAVTALHEPSFEINRVRDVWVVGKRICSYGQALECRMEVGYAVLCEQTDEVKPADGIFAFGRGKRSALGEL